MSEQFYTILTNVGKAKIANSGALGTKVSFVKFKVGDGGGNYYNPTEDQTDVKNKVWEGNISSIAIDESNSNWIIIETVIPTLVGGFTIREAGIFDDQNNLIAIGKYPETYKPIADEGSSKDLLIRMILEVSNAENVNIKVDPTVILATKKDIQVLESRLQEINTQLSDMDYQTAGGTATAITLTTQALRNGYAKNFIAKLDNGGVATTINLIPVYKPGTTQAPTIKANKPYTVIYNGASTCFFLKASATGTALASQVLKNATFSTEVDTDLVGTLDLSLLVSGNIKSGITINGVAGNTNVVDTSNAVLDPAMLVTGYSGYDDGVKKAGTLPNLGSSQTATNTWADGNGRLVFRVPSKGAFTDVIPESSFPEVQKTDANFIAANIISGKNIFGVDGAAIKLTMASGTTKATDYAGGYTNYLGRYLPLASFPFVPKIVIGAYNGAYFIYYKNGSDPYIAFLDMLYDLYQTPKYETVIENAGYVRIYLYGSNNLTYLTASWTAFTW